MRIMKEYRRPVHISSYDVDACGRLRIPTMLAWCQEASDQHMGLFGLNHAELIRRDMAFLLMRMQTAISCLPGEGEDVEIAVCPRGVIGAQYYRQFEMWRGQEKLVDMMESWVLADMTQRKILNPAVLDDLQIDVTSYRGTSEVRLGRIKIPRGLPLLGEYTVQYSDLDFNGHVANYSYARIALDMLPSYRGYNPQAEGSPAPKCCKALWMNYLAESRWGDTLRVYGEETAQGFILQGETAAGPSFACRGEYA